MLRASPMRNNRSSTAAGGSSVAKKKHREPNPSEPVRCILSAATTGDTTRRIHRPQSPSPRNGHSMTDRLDVKGNPKSGEFNNEGRKAGVTIAASCFSIFSSCSDMSDFRGGNHLEQAVHSAKRLARALQRQTTELGDGQKEKIPWNERCKSHVRD